MELNPFELIESKPLFYSDPLDEYKPYFDYDYRELIDSITDEVDWIIEGGFTNYQGDIYFLGKDEQEHIYFVVFGYGSCSGCDALQACDNIEDLIRLRDRLKSCIRKFDSIAEFEEWFNDDAQTEWYCEDDTTDFMDKVNAHFGTKLRWRDFLA